MKKNRDTLNVLMAILLIIILGALSYFIYETTYIEEDEKEKQTNYTLNVYQTGDGEFCLTSEQDEMCSNLAFTLNTETEDAKVISSFSNLFILYRDNGLKIYNVKTKEIKKIDLESGYESYRLYLNNAKNKVAGIIYKLEIGGYAYYNVLKNTKLYTDGRYANLTYLDENYLSGETPSQTSMSKFLLSANEEQVELFYETSSDDYCGIYYSLENFNDRYYFFENENCGNSNLISKIYNNNKQVIYDKKVENYYVSVVNGMLYLKEENVVKKYDTSGNLLITSKPLENIKNIINEYAVYVNNNKLILYNVNTKEEIEIITWQDDYYYDEYTSNYYSQENLDLLGEKDKKAGIYLVINYASQDKNGNYGIEYCYNPDTKEITTYSITEPIGGRAKPVLYLYPKETTNVRVSFEHPEYLTTTYPKYNNGWNVLVEPNGDMYDYDNKYYYALYWDEKRYYSVDFHEGFYVTSENAINFLEEKLEKIGLNDKERNEFIMYWLPILEENKKSLVYFELTEELESKNKLLITPRPDSLLRVSIHIKKVNGYVPIKEQELKTFNRIGFTAIEWGGMTY